MSELYVMFFRYKIHLIVDEIYAFSVHDKDTQFNSVLGMPSLPDPQRTHVLWGFSKVSGFILLIAVTLLLFYFSVA